MKKTHVLLLAAVVAVLVQAPAVADLDDNPNALVIGDAICPDLDSEVERLFTPNRRAPVAIGPATTAVAKSQWIVSPDGEPLVLLSDTPGNGLAALTTWCYWSDAASPTGHAGGDILIARLP